MEGNEGGRARLVVVDDDLKFGEMLVRALSPEHDVVSLTSARDALDPISAGERCDLILCDLMLPGVTGMDVYLRIRELAPELVRRVAFITGDPCTPAASAFLEQAQAPLLEKPFSISMLRAFVRERLGRSPGGPSAGPP
jgi:DNA-binding response OmpR family regulator